ncbi:hypothetical protein [Halopenitus sp. POP-27]|uniref:hypothetical protein n=1 Tax=Halopenitus sp. POP-27 TaxID=2994425 RepID=UPI00246898C0|nr:hypothetical protein [Halopenitus sp. POP-27]
MTDEAATTDADIGDRTGSWLTPSRFVWLALIAVALIVVSFVIRGLSRLVVGYDVAMGLSAPFLLAGGLLVVGLTLRGLLDLLGIAPIDG